jgi:hypothetical protein
LPVVLYGFTTWFLTLREEHWVLRKIFWSKRDKVPEELRRLHNEELYNLYCSPSIVRVIISRRMRWAGNVARMGDRRGAYRVVVGRHEGKRQL